MKNKKEIKLIMIIVLLVVILSWIGIAIYFLSEKNSLKETKDIKSEKVINNYEKITDLYLCQNSLSFDPFKNDEIKIDVKDLDANSYFLLIFRQLELKGSFSYDENINITLKQFDDSALELFGFIPDYKYKLNDEFEFDYQNISFKYSNENFIGTVNNVGCETKFPIKKSRLVNTKGNSLIVDTYEITKQQYEENKLNDPKNSIEEYLIKNKDKLKKVTYKYNFKISNKQYYLKSIEKY